MGAACSNQGAAATAAVHRPTSTSSTAAAADAHHDDTSRKSTVEKRREEDAAAAAANKMKVNGKGGGGGHSISSSSLAGGQPVAHLSADRASNSIAAASEALLRTYFNRSQSSGGEAGFEAGGGGGGQDPFFDRISREEVRLVGSSVFEPLLCAFIVDDPNANSDASSTSHTMKDIGSSSTSASKRRCRSIATAARELIQCVASPAAATTAAPPAPASASVWEPQSSLLQMAAYRAMIDEGRGGLREAVASASGPLRTSGGGGGGRDSDDDEDEDQEEGVDGDGDEGHEGGNDGAGQVPPSFPLRLRPPHGDHDAATTTTTTTTTTPSPNLFLPLLQLLLFDAADGAASTSTTRTAAAHSKPTQPSSSRKNNKKSSSTPGAVCAKASAVLAADYAQALGAACRLLHETFTATTTTTATGNGTSSSGSSCGDLSLVQALQQLQPSSTASSTTALTSSSGGDGVNSSGGGLFDFTGGSPLVSSEEAAYARNGFTASTSSTSTCTTTSGAPGSTALAAAVVPPPPQPLPAIAARSAEALWALAGDLLSLNGGDSSPSADNPKDPNARRSSSSDAAGHEAAASAVAAAARRVRAADLFPVVPAGPDRVWTSADRDLLLAPQHVQRQLLPLQRQHQLQQSSMTARGVAVPIASTAAAASLLAAAAALVTGPLMRFVLLFGVVPALASLGRRGGRGRRGRGQQGKNVGSNGATILDYGPLGQRFFDLSASSSSRSASASSFQSIFNLLSPPTAAAGQSTARTGHGEMNGVMRDDYCKDDEDEDEGEQRYCGRLHRLRLRLVMCTGGTVQHDQTTTNGKGNSSKGATASTTKSSNNNSSVDVEREIEEERFLGPRRHRKAAAEGEGRDCEEDESDAAIVAHAVSRAVSYFFSEELFGGFLEAALKQSPAVAAGSAPASSSVCLPSTLVRALSLSPSHTRGGALATAASTASHHSAGPQLSAGATALTLTHLWIGATTRTLQLYCGGPRQLALFHPLTDRTTRELITAATATTTTAASVMHYSDATPSAAVHVPSLGLLWTLPRLMGIDAFGGLHGPAIAEAALLATHAAAAATGLCMMGPSDSHAGAGGRGGGVGGRSGKEQQQQQQQQEPPSSSPLGMLLRVATAAAPHSLLGASSQSSKQQQQQPLPAAVSAYAAARVLLSPAAAPAALATFAPSASAFLVLRRSSVGSPSPPPISLSRVVLEHQQSSSILITPADARRCLFDGFPWFLCVSTTTTTSRPPRTMQTTTNAPTLRDQETRGIVPRCSGFHLQPSNPVDPICDDGAANKKRNTNKGNDLQQRHRNLFCRLPAALRRLWQRQLTAGSNGGSGTIAGALFFFAATAGADNAGGAPPRSKPDASATRTGGTRRASGSGNQHQHHPHDQPVFNGGQQKQARVVVAGVRRAEALSTTAALIAAEMTTGSSEADDRVSFLVPLSQPPPQATPSNTTTTSNTANTTANSPPQPLPRARSGSGSMTGPGTGGGGGGVPLTTFASSSSLLLQRSPQHHQQQQQQQAPSPSPSPSPALYASPSMRLATLTRDSSAHLYHSHQQQQSQSQSHRSPSSGTHHHLPAAAAAAGEMAVPTAAKTCATTLHFDATARAELLRGVVGGGNTKPVVGNAKLFPVFIKEGVGVEGGEGHGPRKELFDACAAAATAPAAPPIALGAFLQTPIEFQNNKEEEEGSHTSQHDMSSSSASSSSILRWVMRRLPSACAVVLPAAPNHALTKAVWAWLQQRSSGGNVQPTAGGGSLLLFVFRSGTNNTTSQHEEDDSGDNNLFSSLQSDRFHQDDSSVAFRAGDAISYAVPVPDDSYHDGGHHNDGRAGGGGVGVGASFSEALLSAVEASTAAVNTLTTAMSTSSTSITRGRAVVGRVLFQNRRLALLQTTTRIAQAECVAPVCLVAVRSVRSSGATIARPNCVSSSSIAIHSSSDLLRAVAGLASSTSTTPQTATGFAFLGPLLQAEDRRRNEVEEEDKEESKGPVEVVRVDGLLPMVVACVLEMTMTPVFALTTPPVLPAAASSSSAVEGEDHLHQHDGATSNKNINTQPYTWWNAAAVGAHHAGLDARREHICQQLILQQQQQQHQHQQKGGVPSSPSAVPLSFSSALHVTSAARDAWTLGWLLGTGSASNGCPVPVDPAPPALLATYFLLGRAQASTDFAALLRQRENKGTCPHAPHAPYGLCAGQHASLLEAVRKLSATHTKDSTSSSGAVAAPHVGSSSPLAGTGAHRSPAPAGMNRYNGPSSTTANTTNTVAGNRRRESLPPFSPPRRHEQQQQAQQAQHHQLVTPPRGGGLTTQPSAGEDSKMRSGGYGPLSQSSTSHASSRVPLVFLSDLALLDGGRLPPLPLSSSCGGFTITSGGGPEAAFLDAYHTAVETRLVSGAGPVRSSLTTTTTSAGGLQSAIVAEIDAAAARTPLELAETLLLQGLLPDPDDDDQDDQEEGAGSEHAAGHCNQTRSRGHTGHQYQHLLEGMYGPGAAATVLSATAMAADASSSEGENEEDLQHRFTRAVESSAAAAHDGGGENDDDDDVDDDIANTAKSAIMRQQRKQQQQQQHDPRSPANNKNQSQSQSPSQSQLQPSPSSPALSSLLSLQQQALFVHLALQQYYIARYVIGPRLLPNYDGDDDDDNEDDGASSDADQSDDAEEVVPAGGGVVGRYKTIFRGLDMGVTTTTPSAGYDTKTRATDPHTRNKRSNRRRLKKMAAFPLQQLMRSLSRLATHMAGVTATGSRTIAGGGAAVGARTAEDIEATNGATGSVSAAAAFVPDAALLAGLQLSINNGGSNARNSKSSATSHYSTRLLLKRYFGAFPNARRYVIMTTALNSSNSSDHPSCHLALSAPLATSGSGGRHGQQQKRPSPLDARELLQGGGGGADVQSQQQRLLFRAPLYGLGTLAASLRAGFGATVAAAAPCLVVSGAGPDLLVSVLCGANPHHRRGDGESENGINSANGSVDASSTSAFSFVETFRMLYAAELRRLGIGRVFIRALEAVLDGPWLRPAEHDGAGTGAGAGAGAGTVLSTLLPHIPISEGSGRNDDDDDDDATKKEVVTVSVTVARQAVAALAAHASTASSASSLPSSLLSSPSPLLRRQVLQFVTGRTLLPARRREEHISVDLPLAPMCARDFDRILRRLPASHSCGNVLELPNYSEALLLASDSPAWAHYTRSKQKQQLSSPQSNATSTTTTPTTTVNKAAISKIIVTDALKESTLAALVASSEAHRRQQLAQQEGRGERGNNENESALFSREMAAHLLKDPQWGPSLVRLALQRAVQGMAIAGNDTTGGAEGCGAEREADGDGYADDDDADEYESDNDVDTPAASSRATATAAAEATILAQLALEHRQQQQQDQGQSKAHTNGHLFDAPTTQTLIARVAAVLEALTGAEALAIAGEALIAARLTAAVTESGTYELDDGGAARRLVEQQQQQQQQQQEQHPRRLSQPSHHPGTGSTGGSGAFVPRRPSSVAAEDYHHYYTSHGGSANGSPQASAPPSIHGLFAGGGGGRGHTSNVSGGGGNGQVPMGAAEVPLATMATINSIDSNLAGLLGGSHHSGYGHRPPTGAGTGTLLDGSISVTSTTTTPTSNSYYHGHGHNHGGMYRSNSTKPPFHPAASTPSGGGARQFSPSPPPHHGASGGGHRSGSSTGSSAEITAAAVAVAVGSVDVAALFGRPPSPLSPPSTGGVAAAADKARTGSVQTPPSSRHGAGTQQQQAPPSSSSQVPSSRPMAAGGRAAAIANILAAMSDDDDDD